MDSSPSFLWFSWSLSRRAFALAVKALMFGEGFRGTVVGVCFLAGTTVSLAAWWEQYARWWVPVGVFLLLFFYGLCKASYEEVTKANSKVEAAKWQHNELQKRVTDLETRPRTEAEELKHDCLQLGKKLSQVTEEWIADYREAERYEPTSPAIPDAQIEEELQNAKTEEEKQQVIFRLRQREGFATLDQAEYEYDKGFRKRAVKLLELAETRGLVESHWKVEADTAGKDPWAMQRVAKELVRIGHGS